ncbi:helicase-exonuclease AddAB subunit AddA [Planococcus sp. CP5-4]|uniref:helicase-exonuclease AddAB subunit AddA n=1 Tax=unclassified Planococcus (in: firmicutes) TaxID=2662419 RepID=UPI001C2491D2|nr:MULTISPECIES: helicase-exonuclease AddAB subunit AddA [unclassified Planococcus (in: firmicutes)]MBU9673569.1 helicase-exonuclease AddAB subunit AddA [Planococcus sp. CP5-4_YE]MBV0907859.1 helicase-exonuclease AddAB subunit AddA [Planococcus sp. CP5-4_UN]MBW6063026.1 helicase-exonuclease AddAB subunit AddA [Planococcus sp. CP5-4]
MIPKKPNDATWTDEQWRAIWAKGQDMLVSAAAGSGKTAVLINRMIEKVLDEQDPISVDELLVVTFTNASAAEMRHRMSAALEQAVTAHPESVHLKKQLRLINKAQISTLHSFCLQVVKQYAYLLEIDPGFRIAGDTEAALLRDDVMEAVLESAYEGERREKAYRLADSFTSDRSDQAMEILLGKLYDYSRVHPEPETWLEQLPKLYDVPEHSTIDELPFMEDLKMTIRHSFEAALDLLDEGWELATRTDGPHVLEENFRMDATLIRAALDALDESWASLHSYARNIKWERLASVKKDSCDPQLAEEAKARRNEAKKLFNDVKDGYFTRAPERLLEEMREMAPLMRTLVDLTKRFAKDYKALKIDRGLVDFSDLEHYALEILSDGGEASAIAEDYRMRFKEVLVDEYQDTNMLQETIIGLVKSGTEQDGNLFMVGDVKQSIYRFRLAEPMLFLGKYSRFSRRAEGSGLRIDLNANFRSRKEVLDGTNYIFSQIMGERVGEISYDEDAALKPKAPYPEQDVPIHLTLIHEPETEEGEEESVDMDKSQWEARWIAQKIRHMMDSGTLVHDPWSGQERPLEYRDIVVLMRSMTWSGDFSDEFKMAGVPLYAELSGGYFDALEVMIMLNALRVIDNPYQDIPLAAVLRAPFFGLQENELAAIRLADSKGTFYDALKAFIRIGTMEQATRIKLSRFTNSLQKWRDLARRGSLAELIWKVYLDTNYYEMAGAMSNGKQRQANLRALHDRALEYEKTAFRGLFRFLRFIDRMRERGDDLGTAKSLSEKENVVRLMTVHKSKGLEFPVVFFAGTGRPFNEMDFHKPYLFDQNYGLAVKAVNPDTRIEFTSLPYLAVKEMKQLQMKAEEMRVLYVAMTRAKEKLYLTASVKNIDRLLEKWKTASGDVLLPDFKRSRAKSYLDWIGPAVSRHPDAEVLHVGGEVLDHHSRFQIDIVETVSLEEPQPLLEAQQDRPEAEADKSLIHSRFDFTYPHQAAVEKRSKQSVTEMKRLQLLQRSDEPESFIQNYQPKAQKKAPHRPNFLMDRKLSAADIGTAVHTVMQHLPLERQMNVEQIQQFLDELTGREILTKEEAQAVRAEQVEAFFHSTIAQRLMNAEDVRREVPFTYARADEDGDHQIVQGIVDCLFKENGEWILLDYKTDQTRGMGNVHSAMKERYSIQLSVYQEAVEAILRIAIKQRVLYLFSTNEEVEV